MFNGLHVGGVQNLARAGCGDEGLQARTVKI
jgi:hypothetical protein